MTTRGAIQSAHDVSISDAERPLTLGTATGYLLCGNVVAKQIAAFEEEVNPYLLAGTPEVLSIGARCLAKGYVSHWAPYSEAPTMTRLDGQVITLSVRDGCPYLDDVDGCENNNVISAAPAQANSQSVRRGRSHD